MPKGEKAKEQKAASAASKADSEARAKAAAEAAEVRRCAHSQKQRRRFHPTQLTKPTITPTHAVGGWRKHKGRR